MLRTVSPDVPIIADVDWQFAECARACGEILKYRVTSHLWRVVRAAVTVIIVSVLIFMTVLAFRSELDPSTYLSTMTPWIIILLLFLVLRLGGAGWLGAWQIRRNNPHMVSGMRHAISSASYHVRCGQIESLVQWGGIVRVVETKEFFLTFPVRLAAYYLPKRVLTQEQSAALRSIMQQHAGDRFVQPN
jgi:hypothetical protein